MTPAGDAGGRDPRAPAGWLIALAAAWTMAVLGVFLWRFPVPVDGPRALSVLRALLTALVLLVTATLVGRRVLRIGRLDRVLVGPGERLLFSAALGYGALGLVAFGAALAGLLRPLPWIVAAAVLWVVDRRCLHKLEQDLRESLGRSRTPGSALNTLLGAALGMTMVLMLLEALAPPTAYDALRYHLRLPQIYALEGGWVDVPYEFASAFPQNVDMLFSLAFMLGAPAAAGLTHLVLGWLTAGAVGLIASRAAGPGAGLAAAAIFYTMPVVALNSAWAYVDLGLALFTLLAVRSLLGWWREGGPRWIALAGILCGLGMGTKYTGLATLLVGTALIAARVVKRRRLLLRPVGVAMLLFAGLAAVVSSPWWGRNILVRGNPVYPFAADVFGAPEGDTYRAERHRAVLRRPEVPTETVGDLARLPWRFTMDPWVRDEMIGPALLVALPLLALAPGRGAAWLVGVALGYAGIWVTLSPQVRLYVHGLGLLSAAAAAGWAGVRARHGALSRVVSLGMLAAIAASVANLVILQRGLSDPLPVVMGMESRDRYLRRMVDGHGAIEFINRELPADARVLFIGEIYGYYCERDHVLGSKFDRAPVVDWIASTEDLTSFLTRLRIERITHVLYSQVQLRKFADLPGRYLDWPDDRSRAVYREFMTRWLTIEYEDPEAVVGRVLDRPREVGAAAAP